VFDKLRKAWASRREDKRQVSLEREQRKAEHRSYEPPSHTDVTDLGNRPSGGP
jgi:hypothetical protein